MKLANIKILYKILASLMLLTAVMVGSLWYSAQKMVEIDDTYSALLDSNVAAIRSGYELRTVQNRFNIMMWQVIVETDPERIKAAQVVAKEGLAKIPVYIKKISETMPAFAPRAKEIMDRFQRFLDTDYAPIEKLAVEINTTESNAAAAKLAGPASIQIQSNIAALVALIAEMDKETSRMNDATTVLTYSTIKTTVAGVVAASLVVIALAFLLAHNTGISVPITRLVPDLRKIAEGNFTVHIAGTERKDEVGQIANAVNDVAQCVAATIREIKASGREVTNASAEISVATTDLSQRTEEQAASLEETSAAMEELSATVKKNAENAQQASDSAVSTQTVATRGGEVVSQAVDAMSRIEESSRKISDIIGVIDEIARQTNLLALNAAVEAARAGEAGRGFAVVASEVRSLAQRSSQAAKDIKDLITNSNGQVKEGVDLVNRAGHSLSEIVASIKEVASIVSDIANASVEQATGLEQINKALSQMDEVTQQNSALVEENAATAKTLEHQAKAMDDQVAFFQLEELTGMKAAVGDGIVRAAPSRAAPVARSVSSKPRPAAVSRVTQASSRSARANPVGRMQANLATAVKDDWQEF